MLSVISTIAILMELAFIVYGYVKRKQIKGWGRQTLLIGLWGLFVCCLVATRDKYHLSVQASFDPSVSAGLFTIDSMQSTLCCIGGAIIAFAGLSSIFVKKQGYRKLMFFVLGGAVILKTIIIEISRLVIML